MGWSLFRLRPISFERHSDCVSNHLPREPSMSHESITLDENNDLPQICIICGAVANGSSLIQVDPEIKPQWQAVGLIAALLSIFFREARLIREDALDERPVILKLPVCEMHASISLAPLVVTCTTTRRIQLTGVHHDFAEGVRKLVTDKWANIAQQVDDAT